VFGNITFAASPFLAGPLFLGSEWRSFAAVRLFSVVRSLENFEPRVAERDCLHGQQMRAPVVGQGLTPMALLVPVIVGEAASPRICQARPEAATALGRSVDRPGRRSEPASAARASSNPTARSTM
jgi:hypothetical protein